MVLNEIKSLFYKELMLEWRQKYAINGILLYTFSTIFICYLSFNIILSKIIYNLLLMWLLSLLAIGVYSMVLGYPIQDHGLFFINLLLGSLGLSTTLTMISAIASKAGNNGILMAVLSFPIVIPVILMVIKISKNAIDGIARSESMDEIITLCAINLIVGTLAYLLFPYLWRS